MARAYDSDYRSRGDFGGGYRPPPLRSYAEDYGAHDPEAGDYGWRDRDGRRRRLVPRTDWRAGAGMWHGWARGWSAPPELPWVLRHGRPLRGYPGAFSSGYERRENYAGSGRRSRHVPPDWRRYISREEYGLGPGGAYDREFEGDRFRRGPLGARNALFGGEGFVRYDREYDDQWW